MTRHFPVALGLAAALALAAPVARLAAQQPEIVEQVIVRVNGDIVTKSDFERRTIDTLRARPDMVNVPATSPAFTQAVAEVTPQLILDSVDELLLVQRGREMGYALGDVQFDQIVDNIQAQNGLEDDAAFAGALASEGLTMADLRRQLERQMLVQRVQQDDVFARIVVTEEEMVAFYEANRAEFTTPVTLTLRELLIDVPVTEQGVNAGADNAARAEAEQARERALSGEPFAELVAELSDAPSAANGGLIGPIDYTELTPALQAQIDGLTVGGVTDILRTQRGYQILRLESRTQPRVVSFDDARPQVNAAVAQNRSGTEMQQYLERLRTQATITWQNDELEQAYGSALAEQRRLFGAAAAGAAPDTGILLPGGES
jgi:peptidyl-prolyl cis-trans isomerase SurA